MIHYIILRIILLESIHNKTSGAIQAINFQLPPLPEVPMKRPQPERLDEKRKEKLKSLGANSSILEAYNYMYYSYQLLESLNGYFGDLLPDDNKWGVDNYLNYFTKSQAYFSHHTKNLQGDLYIEITKVNNIFTKKLHETVNKISHHNETVVSTLISNLSDIGQYPKVPDISDISDISDSPSEIKEEDSIYLDILKSLINKVNVLNLSEKETYVFKMVSSTTTQILSLLTLVKNYQEDKWNFILFTDYNKSLIAYIKSTINKQNSMVVMNLLQEGISLIETLNYKIVEIENKHNSECTKCTAMIKYQMQDPLIIPSENNEIEEESSSSQSIDLKTINFDNEDVLSEEVLKKILSEYLIKTTGDELKAIDYSNLKVNVGIYQTQIDSLKTLLVHGDKFKSHTDSILIQMIATKKRIKKILEKLDIKK